MNMGWMVNFGFLDERSNAKWGYKIKMHQLPHIHPTLHQQENAALQPLGVHVQLYHVVDMVLN